MTQQGKRYRAQYAKVDRLKKYSVAEAVSLIKQMATTKFDETVDLCVSLSVDPRHSDQMVRGAVSLPHGLGKTVRVIVFAKGEKEKEAREAGADIVGAEELAQKISEGWLDFDKAIATPDMMGQVGKLAKILGPRGLMPNPKVGTVTMDVTKAVREIKAGRVEFRVDKAGIIHAPVGKASFDEQKLQDNIQALFEVILKAKPSSAKGQYVKNVTLSSTMGPGVKVDPVSLEKAAA